MSKLKLQISELRKSTPKYVQWLLLGAAFIVVLILLTLLLTGPKNKTTKNKAKEIPVKITLSNDTIDWANINVGTKKTETITVKTTAPAKATVRRNKQIDGFNVKTTCTDAGEITPAIPCRVILEYAPVAAMKPETVSVFVDWWATSEPDSMKTAEKITVVLGAIAPEVKPEPKPVVIPEPVVEPQPTYMDDFDGYDDDIDPEPTIREEIESIAPSLSFQDSVDLPTVSIPEPIVERPSESCSDFAFPGYDSNGTQIGWIKPERGGYYFHPFSDKDCKNATGIYNPASGIITDINGNGNRIGTDAEHIKYAITSNGALPSLSDAPNARRTSVRTPDAIEAPAGSMGRIALNPAPQQDVKFASSGDVITNTVAYDRTFILRQYKPIPATIVSDVRADPSLYNQDNTLPVRATVDRNVYSDNGRTVIIPAGTLLLGYLTGKMPGPYTAIGRMEINWYQFVLPNGVEFNFTGDDKQDPFSGDAQGRVGVPGRGSTDYMEQFVMPMLTAIVPAAVNMIAPVADKFVNQIDLDNNTVVQSGTLRSSELAKNEIITAWNQVAQKLLVDMMDNTVPPFTIPAGTRITVYSPSDLQVTCGDPSESNKKCAVAEYSNRRRPNWTNQGKFYYDDGSWIGQARSFNWAAEYCTSYKDGKLNLNAAQLEELAKKGLDYSDVLFYCQSNQYKAINNARQEAIYQNQQSTDNKNSIANTGAKPSDGVYTKDYNEQVLGLKYNEDGSIKDPYKTEKAPVAETAAEQNVITCQDGLAPDANGCCTGEEYTDMGEQGFNCCPVTGGDCFPPIIY